MGGTQSKPCPGLPKLRLCGCSSIVGCDIEHHKHLTLGEDPHQGLTINYEIDDLSQFQPGAPLHVVASCGTLEFSDKQRYETEIQALHARSSCMLQRYRRLQKVVNRAMENARANYADALSQCQQLKQQDCGRTTVYFSQICEFELWLTTIMELTKSDYEDQTAAFEHFLPRLEFSVRHSQKILTKLKPLTTPDALNVAGTLADISKLQLETYIKYYTTVFKIGFVDTRLLRYLRTDPERCQFSLKRHHFYPMATTSAILRDIPTFGMTIALIECGFAPVYLAHDFIQGHITSLAEPCLLEDRLLHPLANVRMHSWALLMEAEGDKILGTAVRHLVEVRTGFRPRPKLSSKPSSEILTILNGECKHDPVAQVLTLYALSESILCTPDKIPEGMYKGNYLEPAQFHYNVAEISAMRLEPSFLHPNLDFLHDLHRRQYSMALGELIRDSHATGSGHELNWYSIATDYRNLGTSHEFTSDFVKELSNVGPDESKLDAYFACDVGNSRRELARRIWIAAVQGSHAGLAALYRILAPAPFEAFQWLLLASIYHHIGAPLKCKEAFERYGMDINLFGASATPPEAWAALSDHNILSSERDIATKYFAHQFGMICPYDLSLELAALASLPFPRARCKPDYSITRADIQETPLVFPMAKSKYSHFAKGLLLERGFVRYDFTRNVAASNHRWNVPNFAAHLVSAACMYERATQFGDQRALYRLAVMYSRLAVDASPAEILKVCKMLFRFDESRTSGLTITCPEYAIVKMVLDGYPDTDLLRPRSFEGITSLSDLLANENIPLPTDSHDALVHMVGLCSSSLSQPKIEHLEHWAKVLCKRIERLRILLGTSVWPNSVVTENETKSNRWWHTTSRYDPVPTAEAAAVLQLEKTLSQDPYATAVSSDLTVDAKIALESQTIESGHPIVPVAAAAWRRTWFLDQDMPVVRIDSKIGHSVLDSLFKMFDKMPKPKLVALIKSYKNFLAASFNDKPEVKKVGWQDLDSTRTTHTQQINRDGVDSIVRAQLNHQNQLKAAPLYYVRLRRKMQEPLSTGEELSLLDLGIQAGCHFARDEHVKLRMSVIAANFAKRFSKSELDGRMILSLPTYEDNLDSPSLEAEIPEITPDLILDDVSLCELCNITRNTLMEAKSSKYQDAVATLEAWLKKCEE